MSSAAAAGALLVLPVSCGTGDEAASSAASTAEIVASATAVPTTAPILGDPTDGVAASGSVATLAPAQTEAAAAAATSARVATAAPAASAGVFPTQTEMLVSFSYQPSASERAKRPSVAVWIEESYGNLVETISLWFEQSRKGDKWLSDLPQWYNTSGGNDTTMSEETRVAGDYTVAWDGADVDGNPVSASEYVRPDPRCRPKPDTRASSGPSRPTPEPSTG